MTSDLLTSFIIVFAIIGATEFVDRTNFALIGLSARYRPIAIWSGAATAFWLTTVLSVAIGAALVAAIGHENLVYLRLGGGIFLIAYALYLFLVPSSARQPPTGRSAGMSAFLLIMVLELGDTTMLLTIGFVITMPSALIVALAAGLALTLVAASACVIGRRVGARVEPKHLDRVVVIVLLIVGFVTIVYAVEPGWLPSLG